MVIEDTPPPRDLAALSSWARELADTFVSLASDIALVIGTDGIIDAVAQTKEERGALGAGAWVGRPWIETVTAETRPKIEKLLDEVRQTGRGRRREINHPGDGEHSVPVAYTAVELGRGGPVLAVGRDLRAVAVIQQRFLEAQRDLERGYWQSKQLDARYQLLFEAATDAVVLVDGRDLRVVECNEAAASLFEVPVEHLIGEPVSVGFDPRSRAALSSLLVAAAAADASREVTARFTCRGVRTSVAVTPLCFSGEPMFMLRLRSVDAWSEGDELNATISRLVNESSDCVVVTDAAGSIVVANRAFLGLLKLESSAEVAGRPIADWLSVAGASWHEFREEIRRRGVVRVEAAQVILQSAEVAKVQLTATLLTEGGQERIGFTILRPRMPASPGDTLRRELDLLVARLGREKLPELLEHASGTVERFMARRALEMCEGNGARAASLLGVSAQRFAGLIERVPRSAG